jgi:hypothetical protein
MRWPGVASPTRRSVSRPHTRLISGEANVRSAGRSTDQAPFGNPLGRLSAQRPGCCGRRLLRAHCAHGLHPPRHQKRNSNGLVACPCVCCVCDVAASLRHCSPHSSKMGAQRCGGQPFHGGGRGLRCGVCRRPGLPWPGRPGTDAPAPFAERSGLPASSVCPACISGRGGSAAVVARAGRSGSHEAATRVAFRRRTWIAADSQPAP